MSVTLPAPRCQPREAPQALVHPSQIKQLLTATPADLTLQYQQGGTALMALFRQQPALFYQASTTSPWAVAVNNLQLAKQLLPTNAVASYDLTVGWRLIWMALS